MTPPTTIRYYTTDGSVRGGCGHRHTTLRSAQACCDRDGAGCGSQGGSQGGYSDREVVVVLTDGTTRGLTDGEWDYLCYAYDGGC